MSSVIFSGKIYAENYMVNENLYVIFPNGIADGNTAHVLGTWTKDGSGNKKGLRVVVSGEKLEVRLQNERGESASDSSTLYKLN